MNCVNGSQKGSSDEFFGDTADGQLDHVVDHARSIGVILFVTTDPKRTDKIFYVGDSFGRSGHPVSTATWRWTDQDPKPDIID